MGYKRYHYFGFETFSEWTKSLLRTPQLLVQRAFHTKDMDQAEEEKEAAGEMKRVLTWWHVMMLGVGMIIGAGVFVSTGEAAAEMAGPGVIISFIVAGLSATLSALVYSEFAVMYPYAGGAFNYIIASLGEFPSYLVVLTLILCYTTANAAVARSFSPYLAALFGKPPDFFQFAAAGYEIDFMAFGLICAMTLLLLYTTGGSSLFNTIITLAQLVLIVFLIITGLTKARIENATPFLPFGGRGIFQGASWVFFSMIGFDCVSTLAEEVKNPKRDMPIGIVGCILVVTLIYCLMALTLVFMAPSKAISVEAPYPAAFTFAGYPWASYIVAFCAVLGITTGVLVGQMGVSRILCSLARTHMVPPFMASVSAKYGTPFMATIIMGVTSAVISLFTGYGPLIDMTAIGTLIVFAVVAIALMWKRYYRKDAGLMGWLAPTIGISIITLASMGYALYWALAPDGYWGLILCAGVVVVASIVMMFVMPQAYKPDYSVPLFPIVPSLSILLNAFLLATLPAYAYIQFAYWILALTVLYALYSVHATNNRDIMVAKGNDFNVKPDEELTVVSTLGWGVLGKRPGNTAAGVFLPPALGSEIIDADADTAPGSPKHGSITGNLKLRTTRVASVTSGGAEVAEFVSKDGKAAV